MTDTPETVMLDALEGHVVDASTWSGTQSMVHGQIAALRAAGYRIVPAEPTKEQCEAAHTVIAGDDGGIPEVYRAMLAAAEESGHD